MPFGSWMTGNGSFLCPADPSEKSCQIPAFSSADPKAFVRSLSTVMNIFDPHPKRDGSPSGRVFSVQFTGFSDRQAEPRTTDHGPMTNFPHFPRPRPRATSLPMPVVISRSVDETEQIGERLGRNPSRTGVRNFGRPGGW